MPDRVVAEPRRDGSEQVERARLEHHGVDDDHARRVGLGERGLVDGGRSHEPIAHAELGAPRHVGCPPRLRGVALKAPVPDEEHAVGADELGGDRLGHPAVRVGDAPVGDAHARADHDREGERRPPHPRGRERLAVHEQQREDGGQREQDVPDGDEGGQDDDEERHASGPRGQQARGRRAPAAPRRPDRERDHGHAVGEEEAAQEAVHDRLAAQDVGPVRGERLTTDREQRERDGGADDEASPAEAQRGAARERQRERRHRAEREDPERASTDGEPDHGERVGGVLGDRDAPTEEVHVAVVPHVERGPRAEQGDGDGEDPQVPAVMAPQPPGQQRQQRQARVLHEAREPDHERAGDEAPGPRTIRPGAKDRHDPEHPEGEQGDVGHQVL